MSALFNDLREGLKQAIDFEKGEGSAKVTTYIISPAKPYSRQQIKELRVDKGMSQATFALFMGVSKKTVEAWEGGRSHPTGSAYRLMDILAESKEGDLSFVKSVR